MQKIIFNFSNDIQKTLEFQGNTTTIQNTVSFLSSSNTMSNNWLIRGMDQDDYINDFIINILIPTFKNNSLLNISIYTSEEQSYNYTLEEISILEYSYNPMSEEKHFINLGIK